MVLLYIMFRHNIQQNHNMNETVMAGQDVTIFQLEVQRSESTFSRSTTIPALEDALLDLEEALLSDFGQVPYSVRVS